MNMALILLISCAMIVLFPLAHLVLLFFMIIISMLSDIRNWGFILLEHLHEFLFPTSLDLE